MSNYQHREGKEEMASRIDANEKEIDSINIQLENTPVFSNEFDELTHKRRALRIANQALRIRIENLGKPKCELLETYRLKENTNR